MFALVQTPKGKEVKDYEELFAEFGFRVSPGSRGRGKQPNIFGPEENFNALVAKGRKLGLTIWRDSEYSARDYERRMNRRRKFGRW